MFSESSTLVLYSLQTQVVKDVIDKEGVAFSKREYVLKKYGDTANIFTTVYDFFINNAVKYLGKPSGAEYPYWAFKDLYNIEYDADNLPLKLDIPLDDTILFDAADYRKLITFDYLTLDELDYNNFHKEIESQGLSTFKIMTSNFYPMYKSKIINSWKNIFSKNDELKNGNYKLAKQGVQSFLWQIKKEWIIND